MAVRYDWQKREWAIGASSVAQVFSTLAGMPSGPGALDGLHRLSWWRTSSTVKGAGSLGSIGGRACSACMQSFVKSCESNRLKNVFSSVGRAVVCNFVLL